MNMLQVNINAPGRPGPAVVAKHDDAIRDAGDALRS